VRVLGRHAPAAILFALLAVVWTFPLIRHLSTHLPGQADDRTVYITSTR
jgi:hypothetical protein